MQQVSTPPSMTETPISEALEKIRQVKHHKITKNMMASRVGSQG